MKRGICEIELKYIAVSLTRHLPNSSEGYNNLKINQTLDYNYMYMLLNNAILNCHIS